MNIVKRWVIRIFLFLLLGAIVNVAVAWTAAVSLESGRRHYGFAEIPDGKDAVVHSLAGGPMSLAVHTTWMPTGTIWGDLGGVWHSEKPLPRWAEVPLSDVVSQEVYCWHIAWGWPMVCLRSRFDYDIVAGAWSETARNAIAIPAPFGADSSNVQPVAQTHRWMPLCPIWPGFAINTVFYAVGLWGLFAGPFVLRRLRGGRRIRRSLCPKCAYDLRGRPQGSACPECGSIVAS